MKDYEKPIFIINLSYKNIFMTSGDNDVVYDLDDWEEQL